MAIDFVQVTPGWLACRRGGAFDGTLVDRCRILGRRPLIACGRALVSDGTIGRIVDLMRAEGLDVVVHAGIPPEPTLDDCRASLAAATDRDLVVAIGGGSVLDVAKVAALAPFKEDPGRWFDGEAKVPSDGGLPIVAVPTTAGTGSEATWVGVFTDSATHRKASFRGGAMLPDSVLLDAVLTVSCPKETTTWSGLDAWVQAVEAYTSRGANTLTDALALDSARRIGTVLPRVVEDGADLEGRETMLLASYMAGVALNTARLGLVHGLAHPIGAATGRAHGLLCGMLLPAVVGFNQHHVGERYASLSNGLPGPSGGQALQAFATQLLERTGSPTRLRDLGLVRSDLVRLAEESLGSGSTAANPRPVDFEGALWVLETAW